MSKPRDCFILAQRGGCTWNTRIIGANVQSVLTLPLHWRGKSVAYVEITEVDDI